MVLGERGEKLIFNASVSIVKGSAEPKRRDGDDGGGGGGYIRLRQATAGNVRPG